DIDEAAGLLDEAVDAGEAEPGALADLLGGVERVENLVDDVGRDAGAGIRDLDQHVFADRHALVLQTAAFIGADVRRAQRERTAVGHGVPGVDGEVDDRLLELADVGLDLPEVAYQRNVELDLFAD